MKFLLDENIGKSVALFLTQLGHTPFRIKKIHPGAEDFQVLELSVEKGAILITFIAAVELENIPQDFLNSARILRVEDGKITQR